MINSQTLAELEIDFGEKLKRLRLNKNWDQKTLAARAGVSVRALRNIEAGQGSTVKTLLSVLRRLTGAWPQVMAGHGGTGGDGKSADHDEPRVAARACHQPCGQAQCGPAPDCDRRAGRG